LHDKGANVVIHGEHESEDVTIEKHKRVKIIKSHDSDGVTIISSDEIDEETRARLEEVLKDAGTDGTVMFIDGSELSGDEQAQRKREVRVIKKEVDVTN
jgi:ribosome-interacting GTPase 1